MSISWSPDYKSDRNLQNIRRAVADAKVQEALLLSEVQVEAIWKILQEISFTGAGEFGRLTDEEDKAFIRFEQQIEKARNRFKTRSQ